MNALTKDLIWIAAGAVALGAVELSAAVGALTVLS